MPRSIPSAGSGQPLPILAALLGLLGAGCVGESAPVGPPGPQAAQILALAPLSQAGLAGSPANLRPAVQVLDETDHPIAGFPVVISADGGSLEADTRTDHEGIARVTRWILPPTAGQAAIEVRAGTLSPLRFVAEVGTAGFDVELRVIQGAPSADEQQAMNDAEQIIEALVWGDLPDEQIDMTPACDFGSGPVAIVDERVDDLIVFLRIRAIDGPGGVGGSGSPCLIRDPGTQTLVGLLDLDEDDFAAISQPLKRDFVLHELVHILGFVPGLLNITTPSGFTRHCLELPSQGAPNTLVQDSHFSCAGARAAFDSIGGGSYTGNKVPLENGATQPLGKGTLNHHWRKTTFGTELMTGWFTTATGAPLSLVTARMLEDLGYRVSYAAATPFQLIPPIATVRSGNDLVGLTEPAPAPPPVVYRRRPSPDVPLSR